MNPEIGMAVINNIIMEYAYIIIRDDASLYVKSIYPIAATFDQDNIIKELRIETTLIAQAIILLPFPTLPSEFDK
jgi:hypothetical protein